MKPLTIADSATIILGLQDEIRRTEESRYDHRLHGVLLVAHGMTCPEVAALLGDAPRTVEYWIRGFEEKGLAALREGERSGRPGSSGSTRSTWAYGNASVCFGGWVFGYANLVPRLRKPIPNGRRRIKKTPRADGRCRGRSLGYGRSTLPAARLALSHVG